MQWHIIYNVTNIDNKVELINNMMTQLFDKHAPVKTTQTKFKPAPWLTNDIRHLMTQRDLAYKHFVRTKNPNDFEPYRKLRNKTKQAIPNSKLRYTYNLINN